MKPIVMPAYRPTADSIWSSFRSSGKRHLIFTGSRGSGKSTLLRALFPAPCPGITTWAEPGQAVCLREDATGEWVRIGIFDPALPGPGNQMSLCTDGLTALGIPALERCAVCPDPWITVDEVGYLETGCAPYGAALRRLMEQKQVAAAVRKQDLPLLQELLHREDAFTVDLDDPFGNIGCVIMASGMGTRFGGNKLMADFRGRPMICSILDATEGIFSHRAVVTRHPEVAALCREQGMDTVLHRLPSRSDTVRLGLEAVQGADRCMFCPGDQPLLRQETVAALALNAACGPEFIWRSASGSQPGMPVVFPRWAFPELMALPDGMGGSAVIKKHPERLRLADVRDGYELKDVDSPEDLRELAER